MKLNCLILGDTNLIQEWIREVEIDDNTTAAELKGLIKPECYDEPPLDLDFWACSIPVDDKLQETLNNIRFEYDDRLCFLHRLSLVSKHFVPGLSPETVHILVRISLPVASLGTTAVYRHSVSRNNALGNSARRSETVSGLYARLQKYRLIQVRGTPGTGKTTLGLLIAAHIEKEESDVKIIWVPVWAIGKVMSAGGPISYLHRLGWTIGEKTVFIFDEAQTTYHDEDLWSSFLKNLADNNTLRAILFARYGSPTAYVLGYKSPMTISPILLRVEQRVTLKSIHHDDQLPAIGLFFTGDELLELISQRFSGPEYYFDKSFYDKLIPLTRGHVGALCDFVKVIAEDESYHSLKGTGKHYTWDKFLGTVGPHDLFRKLANSTIFAKGIPRDHQDVAVARVFSKVLNNGSITLANPLDSDNALDRCFINGWLHTDSPRLGEAGTYFFPSPLHRWFVEWKLQPEDQYPAPAIAAGDILTLAINIIRKFSPKRLATEQKLPSHETQSIQFQDEFYRSCSSYGDSSIITFPEHGTAEGHVDFYIPAKEWGVELLLNSDKLAEHSGRFSNPGSYAMSFSSKDYIILDFRTQNVQAAHPDIQKLYYVVFRNNFCEVSILNNTLASIGTFQLLDSA